MTNWIGNKGAGPWAFEKQQEKWGYVNNPRWTDAPVPPSYVDDPIYTGDHDPCGYWPKAHFGAINVNLYGLTDASTPGIWAVYFDGTRLNYIGDYISPGPDLNGFEWFEGDLLTIAGAGATAVLRRVRSIPPFDLISDTASFLTDDLPLTTNTHLYYVSEIEKYFAIGANEHGRIIRLSKTLVREARGIDGTVVTGTDGHLYVLSGINFIWTDVNKPITGDFWQFYWERIQDDVTDSPITAWGVGVPMPTYSGVVNAAYDGGYLYLARLQSVDFLGLRKIDPTTMTLVASAPLLFANRMVIHNGVIYIIIGNTTATIHAYRTSNLTEITNSGVLPHGRLGDLVVFDNSLMVITFPYVADGAVYRLDLTTLAILEMTVIPGAPDPNIWIYQRLAIIDDAFVAAGENVGVGIVKRVGLAVPALRLASEAADPPFLRLAAHGFSGFAQQRLLVGPNTAILTTPTGPHIINPVWTMPT